MGLGNNSNQALRAKVLAQEAQIEHLKAKVRPEGPDTTPKEAWATRRYSEMTPEERRAMSSAEIDEMTARGG